MTWILLLALISPPKAPSRTQWFTCVTDGTYIFRNKHAVLRDATLTCQVPKDQLIDVLEYFRGLDYSTEVSTNYLLNGEVESYTVFANCGEYLSEKHKCK